MMANFMRAGPTKKMKQSLKNPCQRLLRCARNDTPFVIVRSVSDEAIPNEVASAVESEIVSLRS